jgi:hypothetical protein
MGSNFFSTDDLFWLWEEKKKNFETDGSKWSHQILMKDQTKSVFTSPENQREAPACTCLQ